jgi:hypothetical protein
MLDRIEDALNNRTVDIYGKGQAQVEVSCTNTRLWVNVDGICRLRFQAAKSITVDDQRTGKP